MTMQQNQHKRLAKRIAPRLEPTWSGDGTSTIAVLPPVFTTVDPVPTTAVAPTTAAAETTPVQVPTTAVAPTTQSTPAPAPVQTTQQLTTSTPVAPPVEATTSATPQTTAPLSTAPVSNVQQTTVRPSSNVVVQISTLPTTRSVAPVTNARGTNLIVSGTATASASATPSETAAPASGNTGTIVGAVAGSIVGIVCLIAFVSWLVRQHNKRKGGNHDDFDRQSYLRNSMMIPDDPASTRPVIGTQAALALARNNAAGPRPPSMLERKPTYLMANGQPSPSFSPGQVISFDPGQVAPAPYSADGPYPSPMAFAAYTPPAQHHQSELSRRPSGAQLLMRQPTNGGMHDAAAYAHTPSPGGYGSDYHTQSPNGYLHDGYTYPMHPGMPGERGMIQSVTPYQAQQYAEITRALEGPDFAATHESFHPISPVPSPVGQAVSNENVSTFSPSSGHGDMPMANPFEEPAQRVSPAPPSLPPFETLSRTGTPIDPNPQHAHWSYDNKGQVEGHRLSVAGMPATVAQAPTMPAPAHTREERAVVVGNGEELKSKRPVSTVDTDDAYGGM